MHAIDEHFLHIVIHSTAMILGGVFLILFSQLEIKKNNNALSRIYSRTLTILGILFIICFGARLVFNLVSKWKEPNINWEEKGGAYYAAIDDYKMVSMLVLDDGDTSFDDGFIDNLEQNLKNDGYSSKRVNVSLKEKKKLLPYISSFQKYLSIKNAKLWIIYLWMNDKEIVQSQYFCSITNALKKSIVIEDIAIQGTKSIDNVEGIKPDSSILQN